MFTCSACRNALPAGSRFCPRCGAAIAALAQKKSSSSTGIIIASAGFLFLCFVIGVLSDHTTAQHGTTQASLSSSPTPAPTKTEQRTQAIKARKEYAKEIDRQLLDKGIESSTYTTGPDATTLVIKDILAGRVRAHELSKNEGLFTELRVLGFKKLIYQNGLEGDLGFGWKWDLTQEK